MNCSSGLSRPALRLFTRPRCHPSTSSYRLESSFRRTKQRLRIRPDASFKAHHEQPLDHIIFNPPSSAPSVYHTPYKFLPKGDRRRELLASTQAPRPPHPRSPYFPPNSSTLTSTSLPPPVRKPYEKKYHLTEDDIKEMRRLRAEDEKIWTRDKLAEKFNCSRLFVGMVCQASEERLKQRQLELDAIKSKWGQKRTQAREDRSKRKVLWGRGE